MLFSNRGKVYPAIDWEVKKIKDISLTQRQIVADAYDFQMNHGTFIPSLPFQQEQLFLSVLDSGNLKAPILHVLSIALILYQERKVFLDQQEKIKILTSRENEILDLYAKGLALKEIAKFLKISENTIAFHLKNVRHKLGVHTTSQALFLCHAPKI